MLKNTLLRFYVLICRIGMEFGIGDEIAILIFGLKAKLEKILKKPPQMSGILIIEFISLRFLMY